MDALFTQLQPLCAKPYADRPGLRSGHHLGALSLPAPDHVLARVAETVLVAGGDQCQPG